MRVGQTTPVQAEQAFRLNPFSLPARYHPAAEHTMAVYLDRSFAILRRQVAGCPLTVTVPIKMYRGVAIRYTTGSDGPAAELFLAHRDPDLSVALSRIGDPEDSVADWQAWARLFGLPLLIEEDSGDLKPARTYVGSLAVGTTLDRRPHAQFADRRPRFLVRRKPGAKGSHKQIAGREIIART